LAPLASAQLAAMSIDLGSQFTKVGLVKVGRVFCLTSIPFMFLQPGVPMEIVLNRESQRKTPTIVGIRNGERSFSDAASNVVR
jgi:hypoxia up-regulated 1